MIGRKNLQNCCFLILCVVLWESGSLLVPSAVAPQQPTMEYQLLYCPGTVYHIGASVYSVPGRLKLQGRMDGREWLDILGENGVAGVEVPEGFRRLAPDRVPPPHINSN